MTADPCLDPRTGVLRNRLGIAEETRLRQVEADLSYAALADLAQRLLPGEYDLTHLRVFHREIFGDLYPWAGQLRAVDVDRLTVFCAPENIRTYAHTIFAELAGERYLRGLPRASFVDRLTYHFAEVNALRPFRDGNGRTQRAFFHQLAREAGWPIDWTGLDPERNVDATVASLRGDNRPLRDLLDGLVRPAR